MHYLKRPFFPFLLAMVLSVLLMRTGGVAAASGRGCGTWNVVSSPNTALNSDALTGVAAVAARNVWVVGGSYDSNTQTSLTLIEHWDGRQWSIVSSPNVSVSNNRLYGVASIPLMKRMWTVGYSSTSGLPQTLTEFYCP